MIDKFLLNLGMFVMATVLKVVNAN